jgi:capsular polysaccharide transport system ATP-binding protein
MISISGMTKSFQIGSEDRAVFENITVNLPTDRHCAILGGEQAGKSLLIRMLAGVDEPNRGSIIRYANLSFPVGSVRAFRPHLTARQNVEHAARLYGADPDEVAKFVDEVTGMGPLMDENSRRLQLRDRVTLAYAMSYAIPFDTYLIDEHIALGSAEFKEICHAMFAHRAKESGLLLATRQPKKARDYCDMGAVILGGKIVLFDDVEDAITAYQEDLARRPQTRAASQGRAVMETVIETE